MKQYRPWNPDQPYLLPPSPREWLPEGHLALFILDLIEELDLSEIEQAIQAKDPRGTRPYSPRMMVALLLYAYAVGVFSSRKIERATYEDVAFRVIVGDQHPDHWTINQFRSQHRRAFKGLFVQVAQLCMRMGMVKLGMLALDGSKVQANASKHKAMSYGRMKKELKRLEQEIEELMAKAEAVDKAEDERFGEGQREEDLPEEIKRRKDRRDRIKEAMEALQAEAKAARVATLREQAEGQRRKAATVEDPSEAKRAATRATKRDQLADELDDGDDEEDDDDDLPRHRPKHETSGEPKPKAQRNFTDPDSRIMKRNHTYLQAYNCQIVVDAEHQVIVATGVGNQPPDSEYLPPLVERIEEHLGDLPARLLADSGYDSEANMAFCDSRGIEPFISMQKRQEEPRPPPGESLPTPATPRQRMRDRLDKEDGMAVYAQRKHIVEPVFGQIKEARGFRRFLLRGLDKVRDEWDLVCATHNILKLWRYKSGTMAPA